MDVCDAQVAVDVAAFECDPLTEPQGGGGGEEHHRSKARVALLRDRFEFRPRVEALKSLASGRFESLPLRSTKQIPASEPLSLGPFLDRGVSRSAKARGEAHSPGESVLPLSPVTFSV